MTLYSGTCVGGPYHGHPLHHGTRQITIAVYEKNHRKTIERSPGAPEEHGIRHGSYVYEPVKGIWIWYPPA